MNNKTYKTLKIIESKLDSLMWQFDTLKKDSESALFETRELMYELRRKEKDARMGREISGEDSGIENSSYGSSAGLEENYGSTSKNEGRDISDVGSDII